MALHRYFIFLNIVQVTQSFNLAAHSKVIFVQCGPLQDEWLLAADVWACPRNYGAWMCLISAQPQVTEVTNNTRTVTLFVGHKIPTDLAALWQIGDRQLGPGIIGSL